MLNLAFVKFILNKKKLLRDFWENLYCGTLYDNFLDLQNTIKIVGISFSECEGSFSQMNFILTFLIISFKIKPIFVLLFTKVNVPLLHGFDLLK